MDLLALKKQKEQSKYKVTATSKSVKDVDMSKRIVTGMFNSNFFIDSDSDMLVTGSAAKSINERGAGSTNGNKIKHLKDHDWGQVIAELKVLDERDVIVNGKSVSGIYHESFYPESTDSNDQLIKIQAGLYDDRSIGFNYEKIFLAEKESEDKDALAMWNKYFPLAINPEKALEHGFFFVVKEIKLWEGSDVAFGANELTPFLGMKSGEKESISDILIKKVGIMTDLFKKSNLTDDGFHRLAMEEAQLKEYINQLNNFQPSAKDTLIKSRLELGTKSKSKNRFLI